MFSTLKIDLHLKKASEVGVVYLVITAFASMQTTKVTVKLWITILWKTTDK